MKHARQMKLSTKILLILAGAILAFWAIMILAARFDYGAYVTGETEEKYLRNLDKFYPINEYQFFIDDKYRDSLNYIRKTGFSDMDPWREWYIKDVGTIRPKSQLSKTLDSMMASYDH